MQEGELLYCSFYFIFFAKILRYYCHLYIKSPLLVAVTINNCQWLVLQNTYKKNSHAYNSQSSLHQKRTIKFHCRSHSSTNVEHSCIAGKGCILSSLNFFVSFCIKTKRKIELANQWQTYTHLSSGVIT